VLAALPGRGIQNFLAGPDVKEMIVCEGGASQALAADDGHLLQQCRVDTYIASGPGGQHRNRTYSAVRLTHLSTGVSVTGEERRSQHENKQKALGRLRMALALQIRSADFELHERIREIFTAAGPVRVHSRNTLYPQVCATVLDALFASSGSLSAAAQLLHLSTGQLVKIVGRDGDLLTAANRLRDHFDLKHIKAS
jgi:hypothetical protein